MTTVCVQHAWSSKTETLCYSGVPVAGLSHRPVQMKSTQRGSSNRLSKSSVYQQREGNKQKGQEKVHCMHKSNRVEYIIALRDCGHGNAQSRPPKETRYLKSGWKQSECLVSQPRTSGEEVDSPIGISGAAPLTARVPTCTS